jgi:hypothetical protein
LFSAFGDELEDFVPGVMMVEKTIYQKTPTGEKLLRVEIRPELFSDVTGMHDVHDDS